MFPADLLIRPLAGSAPTGAAVITGEAYFARRLGNG